MTDWETIKDQLKEQFQQRLKTPILEWAREVLSAQDEVRSGSRVEDQIKGLKRVGKRFDKQKIGPVLVRKSQSESRLRSDEDC